MKMIINLFITIVLGVTVNIQKINGEELTVEMELSNTINDVKKHLHMSNIKFVHEGAVLFDSDTTIQFLLSRKKETQVTLTAIASRPEIIIDFGDRLHTMEKSYFTEEGKISLAVEDILDKVNKEHKYEFEVPLKCSDIERIEREDLFENVQCIRCETELTVYDRDTFQTWKIYVKPTFKFSELAPPSSKLEMIMNQLLPVYLKGLNDEDWIPHSDATKIDDQLLWKYIDPEGNIQGPFSDRHCRSWNNQGYFHDPGLQFLVGNNPTESHTSDTFLALWKLSKHEQEVLVWLTFAMGLETRKSGEKIDVKNQYLRNSDLEILYDRDTHPYYCKVVDFLVKLYETELFPAHPLNE